MLKMCYPTRLTKTAALLSVILITSTALFCTLHSTADAKQIIIESPEATAATNCTGEDMECYPLSHFYSDNPDSVKLKLASNTTLFFLSGVHILGANIEARDITDLTMIFEVGSELRCVNKSGLIFVNITNLHIIGLSMTNCGAEISASLAHEALVIQTESVLKIELGLQAAIFAINIRNLLMSRTTINGSHGYGFLGVNVVGNSLVAKTLINGSNTNSMTDSCTIPGIPKIPQVAKCLGGNALFVYSDYPECPERRQLHTLIIINSTFSHGLDPIGGSPDYVSRGSGLGVSLSQRYYDVEVHLINSTFESNVARSFGSNLYLRLLFPDTKSTININNCRIKFGRCLHCDIPRGIPYSSMVFFYGLTSPSSLGSYKRCSNINNTAAEKITTISEAEKSHQRILSVEGSEFYKNHGGAIYVVFFSNFTHLRRYSVLIRNCTLKSNEATKATAMYIADISPRPENTKELEMTIEGTTFEGHVTLTKPYTDSQPNTNLLLSIKNVTFRSCTFNDNDASAIVALDTNVHFEGENIFRKNRARLGGAIQLTGQSIIYLRPNVQMTFVNNSALERGGAVYLTGVSREAYFVDCQIQVLDPTFTEITELNIMMSFINNTAQEAGDAVYGGRIDACYTAAPSQFLNHNRTLTQSLTFDSITDFSAQPDSSSIVSSDVITICFCFSGQHNCSVKRQTFSKYPGEEFGISIVGVGQRKGTVPAVVLAYSFTHQFKNNSHQTGKSCMDTFYAVKSTIPSSTSEEFYLAPSMDRSNYPSELRVNVTLLQCDSLTGFTLNKKVGICSCISQLEKRNMSCEINTRMITRQPPYWLGNYSNHLLLHDNCPYDYCKTTPVQIVMSEPNISEQCAYNRYGILCGSCKEGFSQVFGSSRCLECSNTYLLLIIPFALAGILLVTFLFALNLTVSIGTINGLIFYANILKINETTFFPQGDRSFFRAFISWLNLDLGIETCFYDGMDSLVKIWLQFTFPFYLWAIVAITIFMFRHSSRLTRLCGNHSVSVLATIFLLSFTKLQRTITSALSLTTLDFPTGKRALWQYDGNIQYAKKGHLALLLFSLSFLLGIAIPYTLLIFNVQFLRRYSNRWCLRWVNRLMPIFDAYLGPYKNKQGYWTGLLLFVRVSLIIVFASNVSGYPSIDIFVVTVIALLLILINLGQGGVYKQTILTYLEISYILNLGVLAAATALVRQIDGNQRPAVIYTSTAVALATFVGTLVYHTKIQLEKSSCVQKLIKKIKNSPSSDSTGSLYVEFEDSVFGVRKSTPNKIPVTRTVIEGITEGDN